MTRYKYNQGDIFLVSLDPTIGTEIQGKRPVLILSNGEFNRSGRVLVAPITQGANIDRIKGWAVSLMGTGSKTQGAAVLSQCRMIDIEARHGVRIEKGAPDLIEDALAKLNAAIDYQ